MPELRLKTRQKFGKYRIERLLGIGGFAAVYQAADLIEGTRVALKIPHPQLINSETLEEFRKEVRLVAALQHPNILPLKNAEFIEEHLVIAVPLGVRSLGDRLQHRLSGKLAISFTDQILQAVAYAHEQRIVHCDIKPENLLIFPDNHLMLTDFGIARVAQHTLHSLQGSGSGTLGYVAPEQAMGKPSFRSDVFSIGLIVYRMFSGHLPEWPFAWPPPRFARMRQRLHPDFLSWTQRSLELDPRKRFRDACQMLAGFQRIKSRALRQQQSTTQSRVVETDWRTMRFRQFRRRFGRVLEAHYDCKQCHGPVSEAMLFCPWCGLHREVHDGGTRFPQACPRCHRGLKLDWHYCPWCYGAGFQVDSAREYSDVRYVGRCANSNCKRRQLMPFMRYCPWCRRMTRRKWSLPEMDQRCGGCGWGVAADFWNWCPWCGAEV